MSAETFCR